MVVLRVIVYAFAFVCCKACIPYYMCAQIVCVFCFPVLGLFVHLCSFCVRLCMRLASCVAKLRFILHACLYCMFVLLSCFWLYFFMIVCVFCLRCCTRVHLCVATLVFIVHMFVNIAHGFCFRVFSLLVCACMLVLRVLMYWFAFDCCKIVFHITRVYRLHVSLFRLFLVCSVVIVCLVCV